MPTAEMIVERAGDQVAQATNVLVVVEPLLLLGRVATGVPLDPANDVLGSYARNARYQSLLRTWEAFMGFRGSNSLPKKIKQPKPEVGRLPDLRLRGTRS